MKPRPRAVNRDLQGRILIMLLNEDASTSQLTQQLNNHGFNGERHFLAEVRRELISLHHLGVVKKIGIRTVTSEEYPPVDYPAVYFHDCIWSLSDHGRYHHDIVPTCQSCQRRERLILKMGPLVDPHG